MKASVSRRDFVRAGGATALAHATALPARPQSAGGKTRVGVVGVGHRGRSLLTTLLATDLATVPAICDINQDNIARAGQILAKAGNQKPEGYSANEESYKQLMHRDDLDAVLITTPWHGTRTWPWVACARTSMLPSRSPAALSLEECWQLVNTSEETRTPCMMLENWSFRRDNLAVLNMIRRGLFGEILHCHRAHSHNTVDHWFFDKQGKTLWPAKYLYENNRDQYPTHSLGPVPSWMVNCGDYFDYVTSTATPKVGS